MFICVFECVLCVCVPVVLSYIFIMSMFSLLGYFSNVSLSLIYICVCVCVWVYVNMLVCVGCITVTDRISVFLSLLDSSTKMIF